jgi:hypothetical protein
MLAFLEEASFFVFEMSEFVSAENGLGLPRSRLTVEGSVNLHL